MIGEGTEREVKGSEWAARRQGQARDKTEKIKWRPRNCQREPVGGGGRRCGVAVGSLRGCKFRAPKTFSN